MTSAATLHLMPAIRRTTILAAGCFVVVVGILVLLGWTFDNSILKSISPAWVSMKVNTAFGFIFCGMALALLTAPAPSGYFRIGTTLTASLAVLLGGLTLFQYFADINLGIDELFFKDTVMPMRTSHAGRMAPSTAFCFILVGISVLVATLPIRAHLRLPILHALGASVGLIGVCALIGYSVEAKLGNYTGMAAHTSVSFIILGGGLFLWAWPDQGFRWALDKWTSNGFFIGIFLMMAAAAVAYNFTIKFVQTSILVTHRQEIIRELHNITALMADLESTQRGFIITGDETLIQDRDEKKRILIAKIADVRKLTSDNPLQQSSLARLQVLVGERTSWEETTATVRRQDGVAPATRLIASGKGMALSAEIRRLLAAMQQHEYSLLEHERHLAETASTTAFLQMPLGVLLSLTFLSVAFFFLNSSMIEQLGAEENLRTSVREVMDLRTALDVHAIVAITDPRGRITHVNDKFCSISKYSRDELIGQDHRIVNSAYHPKEYIRNLWETISQGRVWTGEIKNRAKDGSHYWVDTTIVPFLGENGKPRQYVAIRADITARKNVEEEIRRLNAELEIRVKHRTAELESANKELEAFSYSVSHDLRAPLRTIDGFSQAVVEDYASLLPEDGRRYLQTIRDGAQRMGQLIDDLLTFSRLSRLPLHRQSISMDKIVAAVRTELEPLSQGRKVEVRLQNLAPATGDPALIKQVWVNLLSNAWKYTRKQENAVIEIGCITSGPAPVWFVRDNGAGFDMQYAHKLFGVFQRLHNADEYEGTGVGLAIVRRVVNRHGGRVWAEAEPNHGATFYFTLEGTPPS